MRTPDDTELATARERPVRARRRGVRRWHRWLGCLAAAPVTLIAVTGVLLNHGMGLQLDQRRVAADWLVDWYGLLPGEAMRGFPLEPVGGASVDWVVQWGGPVYVRGKLVGEPGPVRAAGRVKGEIWVVGDQGVLVLGPEGDLLEEVHAPGLAAGQVNRAGEREGDAVLETTEGVFLVRDWTAGGRSDGKGVRWFAAPQAPPAEIAEEVRRSCRGEGLPWSRVVLDLHSGRFFGKAGRVLYDLAAILLLALVGSGIFLARRNSR